MLKVIKYKLYFWVASYFRFFAGLKLRRWNPEIVVITGSSGKTTLLNLVESQIPFAKYSHHANSSFGIPFHILGLERQTLRKGEWVYLFLAAPFKAFGKIPAQKLYIVEVDCDRPGEGKFLAEFLKPIVTILTGISRTHSMNFDVRVSSGKFASVEKAIAYEFGYFLENAQKLAIVDSGNDLVSAELSRCKTDVAKISKTEMLSGYALTRNTTEFVVEGQKIVLPEILPREVYFSLASLLKLLNFLKLPFDASFSKFKLPPGRSSVFKGIKNITIIDSSYNASMESMTAMLGMFAEYPAEKKWVVLGDMLEQGNEEREEHERLAELVAKQRLDRIVLMGPRVSKYTYPSLKKLLPNVALEAFEFPKEALSFLTTNLQGGEVVLFKGARFLEGVVEHLLLNKADTEKLCRREIVWQERRKKWGL